MADQRLDVERLELATFVARVEHHRVLDSTNDRAKQCAAVAETALPLLIVADEQTAGRGRGDHQWWSPRGSLAMSLLLAPDPAESQRPGQSPLIALAAALAVVETVQPAVPRADVGIHWPNDVMAGGRKLAGVLVEVLSDATQVIGIGINTDNTLADAPAELQETATTMRDLTGQRQDRTTFLVELLRQLESALRQAAAEPGSIGRRANELCRQRGKTLALQLGSRTIRGRCVGIAPDGALLLDTDRGQESFYSGVLCPTL